MAKMSFYKPNLLLFNGLRVSDHSRAPLQENFKRIETSNRMVDGRLRKYVVATKREFSTSWDLLPHTTKYTVDGFMGAQELEEFYQNTVGSFQLIVVTGNAVANSVGQPVLEGAVNYTHPKIGDITSARPTDYKANTYTVHFTDFSKEYVKRGKAYDMYNVSLGMEEI